MLRSCRRLHQALAPLTRGRGAILAFHHVRPQDPAVFAPNRGLAITPEHLDAVLTHLRQSGYRIVPLDAVPDELAEPHGVPFVALPAFPCRAFRHSAVFVHRGSGITGPADLVGRTIGEFGVYGQDPGVWMKGILAEEYGFRPEANRWMVGGLDHPAPPFTFTTQSH